MPRQRAGSAYQKSGVWYWAITLRSGKRHAKPVPPHPKGLSLTKDLARSFALEMQAQYDAGIYTPEVKKAPTEEAFTVLSWARKWAQMQKVTNPQDLTYAIERHLAHSALGVMRLSDVRPKDVLAFVEWLRTRPTQQGRRKEPGVLAPRSQLTIWSTVKRALDRAAFEELCHGAPTRLPNKCLPAATDKDPSKRAGRVFSHEEVELLLTSPKIPPDRRVFYGLVFLTGLRFGEASAVRFCDYDPTREPLGCLLVAKSYHSKHREIKTTKTNHVREVPVHPTLAAMLAEWRLSGYAAHYGSPLKDEGPLIPTKTQKPRSQSVSWYQMQDDLGVLGLRKRTIHDARRTFISLALEDGARGEVLDWVTHDAGKRSVRNMYTTLSWATRCAEVAKLKIRRRVALPGSATNEA
jgi:integrase